MANGHHIRVKVVRHGLHFGDNPRNQLEGTEDGILSFLNRIDQFLEVFLITVKALNQYRERLATDRIPQEIRRTS